VLPLVSDYPVAFAFASVAAIAVVLSAYFHVQIV